MNFSLFRIIGNSLPPRHSPENNIRSVEFIIRNEPRFDRCERVWVLNKLSDAAEKRRMISLLDHHGEKYIDIPFDHQAHFNAFFDPTGLPPEQREQLAIDIYQKENSQHALLQEWVIRHKSQLLVGINQARNEALRVGRQNSTWTLVLDGGVFFTRLRWERFVKDLTLNTTARVAITSMRRIYDWQLAKKLCIDESRIGVEFQEEPPSNEEPQMAFHCDSEELFDERLRYGHRNKAELLLRLGVPGPWKNWHAAPWDRVPPLPTPNKGKFLNAGSVIRLPTDGTGQETGPSRYTNRFTGVASRALQLDLEHSMSRRKVSEDFALIIPKCIEGRSQEETKNYATELLDEVDIFITDKPAPAPSGSLNHYFSVAPYWNDGGIRTDGLLQRQDGSDLEGSDRHALRRFASRAYGLAVCGLMLGNQKMLDKAADLLRKWLLVGPTRMMPTARFAQCIPGRSEFNEIGLVEFRHLALIPFAARILSDNRAISSKELAGFKAWFAEFMQDSESIGFIGNSLSRPNNIGTWSSVLFCSAALFTESYGNAFFLAETASIRLGKQLDLFSIQHYECRRSKPLNYSLFNLAAWLMMAQLASYFCIQLNQFKGVRGESLVDAVSFCSDNRKRFSDYSDNSAEYDVWIGLLEKAFSPRKSGEIAVVKNLDFGLPPVLLV